MPLVMEKGQVSVIRNGNEWDFEWQLDFTSLFEEDAVCYWSPEFSFEDETWFMKMFLNGHQQCHSSGYINLILWRLPAICLLKNLEFSVFLKTLNGRKEFKKQITRVSEGVSYHEIKRFLPLSDFERRQSEFVSPFGHFTIVCTLKRLDSAENSSNIAVTGCSYCEKSLDVREISSRKRKRRVKCLECSDVILLQNWDGHECKRSRSEGKASVTESSKILEDLKELFLKRKDCDVLIRVKGQEFSAHRAILIARSPVFESTFRNDMKEKATGVIDIEDCDPSSFSEFLHFLYCADADAISEGNVFSLFVTADKYDVKDLIVNCIEFMNENLSIDTICETITLALQYSQTELLNLATDFFIKESEKIITTVKWQTFLVENPIQANKLFIKALSNAKSSKV